MDSPTMTGNGVFDVCAAAATECERKGKTVKKFGTIDSTNLEAKKTFGKNEILIAKHQTNGRGRYDRTWQDEPGRALLLSYSRCLNFSPQPILAPLVGLALVTALKNNFNTNFTLKPPNDIYVGKEKLAGILIESIKKGSQTQLVIGIGINVLKAPKSESFPATSISDQQHISKEKFQSFVKELIELIDQLVEANKEKLEANEQKEILNFLNANESVANDPYTIVHQDGSLESKQAGIRHWQDL